MSYKEFETNDVFYNVIKTKPRFEFKIWNGKLIINDGSGEPKINDLHVSGSS